MEYPSFDKPKAGAFRFNTDSSQLEIYDGNQWTGILATSPELHTGGTRGVIFGGYAANDQIGWINIATAGNEVDSGGDMLNARYGQECVADRTRGIACGGRNDPSPGADTDVIEYVTIATTSNGTDFGDLMSGQGWGQRAACSDSTRGIIGGGYQNPQSTSAKNIISYITIQTTGNAQDFGDLTQAKTALMATSSPTRGVWIGGRTGPGVGDKVATIEYSTIATLGNNADFGDLTAATSHIAACSNAVRALSGMGYISPSANTATNTIEYVTIATLGNSLDFGDSTRAHYNLKACSSSTRGVFVGGGTPSSPYNTNTMDYGQFASTGNLIDFGDLLDANNEAAGCTSNGHGGL